MGTPELAAASLEALLASDHEVVCVVSQPDRRAGRGKRMVAPPVAQLATERGLPLLQPETIRTRAFRAWVEGFAPEVGVVAAFGHILGPKVLAIPPHGWLNVHASLLPRWRGASPIQAAVCAGDAESGVTIMQMDRGLDTGPMRLVRRLALADDETAATLHDRLAAVGGEAIVAALDLLAAGDLPSTPQPDEGSTYAPLLSKRDGDLDWTRPAEVLARRVRGLHPWPGTRTHHRAAGGGEPTMLKVHPPVAVLPGVDAAPGSVVSATPDGVDVACGEGLLRLQQLQAPGKRALPVGPFLAGYGLAAGDRLEAP